MNHQSNIMNRKLYIILASALLMLGGCSSDNDDEGEKKSNVAFTPVSTAPDWSIDWTSNDPVPDWEDPAPTKFECSMNMLVGIASTSMLMPYSTDDDLLAVFVGDECRGVSHRNVTKDGDVLFLVHAKGASEEAGLPTTIRYYSAGARQLFINDYIVTFTPNNLMDTNDDDFSIWLSPLETSTKYPHFTFISTILPDNVPFTVTPDDKMAVFVGNECRGFCKPEFNDKLGTNEWGGIIYTRGDGERGQLRYYSAEKQGVYIIADDITLNNQLQKINVTF